ncbi:MAG: hypothetical protein HRT53_15670 [Colwellia sp.]|nr:hypothetical protein [Colwellia sp.]
MHINLRRNANEYNEAELLHFQKCQQCQSDFKSLEQLNSAGNSIPIIIPDELNWQIIKQRTRHSQSITNNQKSKPIFTRKIMAIAASTFFIATSWLVVNNYQLQLQLEQTLLAKQTQHSQFLSVRQADFEQQLEQVLQRTRVLERQLKTNDRQSFQQAELLIKVNALEQQLHMSNSAEEQLRVLNVRQEVINDILKLQKGTMYEYSI